MKRFTNISNTQLLQLINEWIKNERDRHILKRRLIDGIRLEPLAEEFDLTVDRIKQIVYTDIALLKQHI